MELQGVPRQTEKGGSGNNFIIFKLKNTSGDSQGLYTSKIQGKVPLVLDKSKGYNGAQVCNNENNNINEKIK